MVQKYLEDKSQENRRRLAHFMFTEYRKMNDRGEYEATKEKIAEVRRGPEFEGNRVGHGVMVQTYFDGLFYHVPKC